MSSKQKRPLGDANEEMDPNKKAKIDGEWAAKEIDSSITSSSGASQRDPNPTTPASPAARDVWHLGETRRAIFAKIQNLEGQDAVNSQQSVVRENLARRKVYEEMYAKGYGSSNGAAIIVNIEFSVDARLWTDHVQNRTSEEFPWEQPEMFREDTGYADFVKSISHAGKWSAIVLDNDETVRVKHEETPIETQTNMTAEGKDSTIMSAPIKETKSSSNDKDGNLKVGESQLVMRTNASVVVPGTADGVGPSAETQGDGKAKKIPWSPEQMTELYEEMFGADAPRLDGIGRFELPMEASLAPLALRGAVLEARTLFPAPIEIRPVSMGWGRNKLCLRFASWVKRDQSDFPVLKYYLVWSWCILVQWKGRLLKQAADAEKASEPPESMYDGIRWVVDHWTEQAANKQADLSLVDEAWSKDVQFDMAGLEDEASKQRLYDAVSKVIASSRGQDNEARACGVVDWAGVDTEKFGAGPRTRTCLAIEAMCRYCASERGEEKLSMIAQQMMSEKHVAPALLKKWAGQAAKDSKPAPK